MEHESSLFSDPHFWVMVGFGIFLLLAGPKIWKALGAMLDQRALRIKANLDEAQKLRDEAEGLLADYRRKQEAALAEAVAIAAAAKESAARQRADAERALEATLKRREALALEKIAQAEVSALAEVRREAVDLAAAAARRLIADSLDATKADALIDRGIAELPRRLN